MFGGKEGKDKLKAMHKKAKTFNPGDPIHKAVPTVPPAPGPSPEDVLRIREAIANARSLEEVQHLETMLKAGQIPGTTKLINGSQEEEEDDMEDS